MEMFNNTPKTNFCSLLFHPEYLKTDKADLFVIYSKIKGGMELFC